MGAVDWAHSQSRRSFGFPPLGGCCYGGAADFVRGAVRFGVQASVRSVRLLLHRPPAARGIPVGGPGDG